MAVVQQQNQALIDPKRIEINGKEFVIGKIPAIPGISLMTKCASVVEAASYQEIDTDQLVKLAEYASVVRDGVEYRLNNLNAINTFTDTEELWKVCLEVYAHSFGFFIAGGTRSLMKPLIDARKEAVEPQNTGM